MQILQFISVEGVVRYSKRNNRYEKAVKRTSRRVGFQKDDGNESEKRECRYTISSSCGTTR